MLGSGSNDSLDFIDSPGFVFTDGLTQEESKVLAAEAKAA
jgi:hypothetical protein